MCGFVFPGQGFYNLRLPDSSEQKLVKHVGQIQVVSGDASVEKLDEELKHRIDKIWNWNVKMIAENEFPATFPNKQLLDTFSKSKAIEFAIHNISAKLSKLVVEPIAFSFL